MIVFAATAGVWLFYVQHQYEEAYWRPRESWDFTRSALEGSSYYRLPPVLQWFTGNIGYHHVHHLNPHIPFYRLPEVLNNIPELQTATTTSLRWKDIRACLKERSHAVEQRR